MFNTGHPRPDYEKPIFIVPFRFPIKTNICIITTNVYILRVIHIKWVNGEITINLIALFGNRLTMNNYMLTITISIECKSFEN